MLLCYNLRHTTGCKLMSSTSVQQGWHMWGGRGAAAISTGISRWSPPPLLLGYPAAHGVSLSNCHIGQAAALQAWHVLMKSTLTTAGAGLFSSAFLMGSLQQRKACSLPHAHIAADCRCRLRWATV